MTKRKLNEYENGELSFHGDLKTNQIEMDIQISMLKHKVSFNQFGAKKSLYFRKYNSLNAVLSEIKFFSY